MLVARVLVPVDMASSSQSTRDSSWLGSPAVIVYAREVGFVARKELLAEAMLENGPSRPHRR